MATATSTRGTIVDALSAIQRARRFFTGPVTHQAAKDLDEAIAILGDTVEPLALGAPPCPTCSAGAKQDGLLRFAIQTSQLYMDAKEQLAAARSHIPENALKLREVVGEEFQRLLKAQPPSASQIEAAFRRIARMLPERAPATGKAERR